MPRANVRQISAPSPAALVARICAIALSAATLASVAADLASNPAPIPPPPHAGLAKAASEQGVRWSNLTPAQRAALQPLEREWPGIDPSRKQKWLELSARFPRLSPPEQARVQQRMSEWARLTPLQRADARLHFQQFKQLPAADRQARWEAYQALSPEERQRFAARAAQGQATNAPLVALDNVAPHAPNSAPAWKSLPGPRVIGPTIVQARPGVTTTSISKTPALGAHPRASGAHIAGTPGLVNKATLLPQHGPQGESSHSTRPNVDAPPSGR